MTPRCPDPAHLNDFLDGLLEPTEAAALRDHLHSCAQCTAEVAAYRRVFGALERVPFEDPGRAFTERVLAIVVPSRARRRWLRTVGWTYAGSLAASMAAAMLVVSTPGTRVWLDMASAAVSRHTIQLMMFVLNSLGFATLGLANVWGAVTAWAGKIAPLPRAIGSVMTRPPVEIALWSAAVIGIAVLWGLHGRERSSARRAGPLGLMGV